MQGLSAGNPVPVLYTILKASIWRNVVMVPTTVLPLPIPVATHGIACSHLYTEGVNYT
jgi:hypothetical protein